MHVVTGVGREVCAEAEILSGAAGNTCKKVRLLRETNRSCNDYLPLDG